MVAHVVVDVLGHPLGEHRARFRPPGRLQAQFEQREAARPIPRRDLDRDVDQRLSSLGIGPPLTPLQS
jgi:hypothetical protein